MTTYRTDYSRLEQRSVIKLLLAEECKQCEINRRMCHVYGKSCFSPKSITNWLNNGLPVWARGRKIVHRIETLYKENVPGEAIGQEGQNDILLRQERNHSNWFPWKRLNFEKFFLLPIPQAIFHLYNDWLIYLLIVFNGILLDSDMKIPLTCCTSYVCGRTGYTPVS